MLSFHISCSSQPRSRSDVDHSSGDDTSSSDDEPLDPSIRIMHIEDRNHMNRNMLNMYKKQTPITPNKDGTGIGTTTGTGTNEEMKVDTLTVTSSLVKTPSKSNLSIITNNGVGTPKATTAFTHTFPVTTTATSTPETSDPIILHGAAAHTRDRQQHNRTREQGSHVQDGKSAGSSKKMAKRSRKTEDDEDGELDEEKKQAGE
jgi:hypothetical protein